MRARRYAGMPVCASCRNSSLTTTSQLFRLEMDDARAKVWKDLPTGSNKKKSWIVSERVGITAEMLGIDSIMADALLPYKQS